MYLRDTSAYAVPRAVSLRQKLQIQLAISQNISQGKICLCSSTCCFTKTEAADPTGYLTEFISGTDLLMQFQMLSHKDRSCRSNWLSHRIYLRDRSAYATSHAVSLRQKLQIQLAISKNLFQDQICLCNFNMLSH